MDKKLQEAYKNLELEFKRKNYNLKQQELQQNKEIAEKQIAAQDRVNISLTEYKNITNKISELERKNDILDANNCFLEDILNELHINNMLQIIDRKTIKTIVNDDCARNKKKVHITFEIEPLI